MAERWFVSTSRLITAVLVLLASPTEAGGRSVAMGCPPPFGPHFSLRASTCPGDIRALHELRWSLQVVDDEWPLAGDPCLSWKGVECESRHVVGINLSAVRRRAQSTSNTPLFPTSNDVILHFKFLRSLNASGVPLFGTLPIWMGGMTSLEVLDFVSSSLSGSIPSSIGAISNLRVLRLADNNLSGLIPPAIGSLVNLEVLDLERNKLQGEIPVTLNNLRGLRELRLSSNLLQGSIQYKVRCLLARQHELSSRNLVQRLPSNHANPDFSGTKGLKMWARPVFKGAGRDHVSAAAEIPADCVDELSRDRGPATHRILEELLQFPANDTAPSENNLVAILGGFGGISLIVLMAIFGYFIIQHERRVEARKRARRVARQRARAAISGLRPLGGKGINFARLGESFSYSQLQQCTGQFNLSNVIMTGHTGDLFKGVLSGNHVVVKRIDMMRFKSDLYISELEFFSRVSHPRIVPLLGHCLDREDEKLLVYKFMPIGDLAYALHRRESPSHPEMVLQSLDWITRLKIATGAAEALVYLHHECTPPLVHRDIKASSILLDDKYEVRLGSLSDTKFHQGEQNAGVFSRFLRMSRSSEQSELDVSGLRIASCSYDVFCFGKVLLELVSGKLGISGSLDPGADAWIDWALPFIDTQDREPLVKIMDPSLIVDEDLMEEVWATAIVAKSCLTTKPSRRPNMKHILKALENPLIVVRDDHSGPIKSRQSSFGSWNAALFGSWRPTGAIIGGMPGPSSSKDYQHDLNFRPPRNFLPQPADEAIPTSAPTPQYTFPVSREISPVPADLPLPPNQESDDSDS